LGPIFAVSLIVAHVESQAISVIFLGFNAFDCHANVADLMLKTR
jgi:hypothetical protein